MVINPTGDLNDDLDFEYDGAEAHNGCAATLMGEFWYFGGGTGSTDTNKHKRQVNWLYKKYKIKINISDEQSWRM